MFEFDSIPTLTLAQGATPPAPGESIPLEGTSATPGGPGGPGPPTGKSPFGGQFFIIMLVLLVGMILFSVLGQRRDRKKREAMIKAVKKHDRVQTIGGVIGAVMEVKSNSVVLKVDETSNTRITFARSAIQQVLTTDADADAASGDAAV